MTSPSLPEHWRDLVAGYVLGDLDPAEQAQVDQWRQHHAEVAAELAALQQTWTDLPYGLPSQAPPADLRDRVMAAVAAPVAPSPAVPVSRPSRPRWGLYGVSAGWAVTAIALVAVAMDNQQLRRDKQQAEAVVARFAQPGNPIHTLAGTDSQPQATGRLVVDDATQLITVTTQDLPPLPADQVYRLWALADAAPVYCGQFNPEAMTATSEWAVPDALCTTEQVQLLVTREATADPPTPQGPLVLEGPPPS